MQGYFHLTLRLTDLHLFLRLTGLFLRYIDHTAQSGRFRHRDQTALSDDIDALDLLAHAGKGCHLFFHGFRMHINAARDQHTGKHQDPQNRHCHVQHTHLTDKIHQAGCKTVLVIVLIVVIFIVIVLVVVVFVVVILIVVVFVVVVLVIILFVVIIVVIDFDITLRTRLFR